MDRAFYVRIGPDLDRGAVRPDAGERQRRRDIDVGRETACRFASAAGEDAALRPDPAHGYAVLHQIRRAFEPGRRLPGDHVDARDLADGDGLHSIEAKQRAGWHQDAAAALPRHIDKVEIFEKRT